MEKVLRASEQSDATILTVYGSPVSNANIATPPNSYPRPRHVDSSNSGGVWATADAARSFHPSVHPMRRTSTIKDKNSGAASPNALTPTSGPRPLTEDTLPDEDAKGHSTADKWRDAAQEYCRNTSLHGLRYVGDVSNTLGERCFWVLAFVVATVTSVYYISNLYHKWETSPVINSISPVATSVVDIPFPALTICNVNKARRSIVSRYPEHPDTSTERLHRRLLNDMCDDNSESSSAFEDDVDRSSGNSDIVMSFMVNVSQPCHEMLVSCLWRGEPYLCENLFNPALTDEGICCSFNRVKRDLIFRNPKDLSDLNVTFPFPSLDWTPERGYPADAALDQTPWRPWGVGAHLGLTLTLDAELHDYYCSPSTAGVGFKMLLHNPVETPKVSGFGSLVAPGHETRVAITPIISHTASNLRSVAQAKRQCIFADERYLQFYRTYTQRNCVMECEANFTLTHCNCVNYYMPKDRDTRTCGKKDEKCATTARLAMELRLVNGAANLTHLNITNVPSCHCLPGCSELSYSFVSSTSPFAESYPVKSHWMQNNSESYFRNNMAVVTFFFTETLFPSRYKGELFGFTEFLSNTGGLLGLFIGFSFLSVVEAVYFVSIRLYCSWYRMRAEQAAKKIMRIKGKKTRVVIPYPFAQ